MGAPGGNRPAPSSAPAAALAPGFDRSKAILFAGGTLIGVNYLLNLPLNVGSIFSNNWPAENAREGWIDPVLQLAMLGGLYLVSRISDVAGTAALLFLAALWLAFIYSHASPIEAFIAKGGAAAPSSRGVNPSFGSSGTTGGGGQGSKQ